MNTNEILERMRAGESADVIAAELSKMLNEAKAELEAEEKKKREEEAKRLKEEESNEALTRAVQGLVDYIEIKCPDVFKEIKDMTMEDVVNQFQAAIDPILTMYPMMMSASEIFERGIDKPASNKFAPKTSTADEKIKNYMKKMGW